MTRDHGSLAVTLAAGARECPDCGKKRYPSRKAARAVARILYPGTRMRAYPCGQWFHLTSQSTRAATKNREYAR